MTIQMRSNLTIGEQICLRHVPRGSRGVARNVRFSKRETVRAMRRLAKKFLDDAPTKLRFRGYSC